MTRIKSPRCLNLPLHRKWRRLQKCSNELEHSCVCEEGIYLPVAQCPDSSPATSGRRHQIEPTPLSIALHITRSNCVRTENCLVVMWSTYYISSVMVLQSLYVYFHVSQYGSLHLGLLMLWLFPKSELGALD